MIKPGDIIKHERFSDVALRVDKVLEAKVLLGTWINQGQNVSWLIGEQQCINIRDWSEWLRCMEPRAKCVRHVEWKRLGRK